jgi:hypothetical protein
MRPAYPYDPAIHRIVDDTPFTDFFRRELRRDDIVVWHFTDVREPEPETRPGFTVNREVWVLSLFDGVMLLDIGHLLTDENGRPYCTRELAQAIIRRLKDLITTVEARKRLKSAARDKERALNDMAARQLNTRTRTYRDIEQSRGENAADQYAMADAPELIDGGPWSIKSTLKKRG